VLAVEVLYMDTVVKEVKNFLGIFLIIDTSNVTTVPAGAGGLYASGSNNGNFGKVMGVTINI
jgi:hypothetical protein